MSYWMNGSGRGSRTPDTRIMIPPLYQLSYSAITVPTYSDIFNESQQKSCIFKKNIIDFLSSHHLKKELFHGRSVF